MRHAVALAALAALAACHGGAEPAAPSKKEGAAVAAPKPPHSPRSRREQPTTDGTLAIENFQAQITAYEKMLDGSPRSLPAAKALVGLYGTRAQFMGQLVDYARECALAEKLVREHPEDPAVWPLRAGCRASMHEFAGASADLDEAEKRGARKDELAGARAGIEQALGHYDAALAIRQKKADDWATISSLGALASLYSERGDTDRAEELFIKAQDKQSDTSPMTLAWLYFQEGLMWQKAGSLSRARELFEAAHDRLPAFAPATSHLASVLSLTGERARALELLKNLVATTDDPEYVAQLAGLSTGAERDALIAKARAGYQALVAEHPAAFADHAARFWLDAGDDPKRALELARLNLTNRQTAEAYQLFLDAAFATKHDDCATVAAAARLPNPTAGLRFALERARPSCAKN